MVRAKEAADSSAGRDPSGEGEDVTVDGAITGGMGRAGVSGRDGVADRDDVGTRGGTTDGAKEGANRSVRDAVAGEEATAGEESARSTGGMGRAGVSGRDGVADRDDVGTRGGTTDGAKEASGRSIGDGAAGAGEDPVAGGADTDATCVIGRGGVSGRDGVVVRGGAADDGAADGEKAGMEGAAGPRGGEATE